jgi:hypothetical protein
MKAITKVLGVTALGLVLASPAMASGLGTTEVLNGQLNFSKTIADLDMDVRNAGAVSGSAIAIGNSASVATANNTDVVSKQDFRGVAKADLDATLRHVHGDVELSSVAMCNNLTVGTDPEFTNVKNEQLCNIDPTADLDANIKGVGGDVWVNSAAIANNASVDALSTNADVVNKQINRAGTYANVGLTAKNVDGHVSATAAAIGNNLSVTQSNPY